MCIKGEKRGKCYSSKTCLEAATVSENYILKTCHLRYIENSKLSHASIYIERMPFLRYRPIESLQFPRYIERMPFLRYIERMPFLQYIKRMPFLRYIERVPYLRYIERLQFPQYIERLQFPQYIERLQFPRYIEN
jgi:hypothetical protein